MERRIPFSPSALSKIKNQTYVTKITSKNLGSPLRYPTNKVYPPEKSPLFIEKRAYQGNTGNFYPLAGLTGP